MTRNLSPIARAFGLFLAFCGVILTPRTAHAQPPSVVAVSAEVHPKTLAPGGKGVVAVTYVIEDPYHINAGDLENYPGADKGLIATKASLKAAGLTQAAVQWPKAHVRELSAGGIKLIQPSYEGTATVFVPFTLSDSAAAGELEILVTYSSQACTTTCLPEEEGQTTVKLSVAPDGPKEAAAWPQGFDASKFGAAPKPPAPHAPPGPPKAMGEGESPAAGGPAQVADTGFFTTLGLCFVGGFILNLMPCVLPVIPLKIAGFQRAAQHQGGGRSRAIMLGTMTGLGVVAFWFVIAVLLSVLKVIQSVNEIFGNPYFQIGAAAVIGVMALGMMGAFIINLPQSVQNVNVGHDTLVGSFMFGVMTAVLGTPCFGPFIGGALSWATQQSNALIPLTAITMVGIGMAVPYVVLSAFPGLAKKLPKAGPISDMVKHVLGLLMIAVAVFFLWNGILSLLAEKPYMKDVLHWWAVAGLSTVAGLLVLKVAIQHARSGVGKVIGAALFAMLTFVPIWWAQRLQGIEYENHQANSLWAEYSADAEQSAKSANKVVFTDFTAIWCINCKLFKAQVLSTPEVKAAMKEVGAVGLLGDLSSRVAPGWAKLKAIGEVGIPVVSIEGPGVKEPIKLRFGDHGIKDVVDALHKAAGKVTTQSAWQPWTPEAEQAAKAAGKTVVVNFDADWEISNRVFIREQLNTPEIQSLLAKDDVVLLSANLTAKNAPGWGKLKALGETGIPLTVIEHPGAEPRMLRFGASKEDVRVAFRRD